MKFPERRRGTRFLTLKNAAWVFGGLFVLFIAYSSYNELRPQKASRDRLYERGIKAPPPTPVRKPVEVIEEGRALPRYVPPREVRPTTTTTETAPPLEHFPH